VFEVTAPSVTLSALLDRVKQVSWDLFDGQSGDPAGVFVRHRGEERFRSFVEAYGTVSPTKFTNIELKYGDQLLLHSPGGGGCGDANKRSDGSLADDLRDRFITPAGLSAYGRPPSFADGVAAFG